LFGALKHSNAQKDIISSREERRLTIFEKRKLRGSRGGESNSRVEKAAYEELHNYAD
jgi:hypothetical protein